MQTQAGEPFRCRSCGSDHIGLVLNLGPVPASDVFPLIDDPDPDRRFPLELVRCERCTLLQLGPAATLQPEAPTAVESATAAAHAERSVAQILRDEGLQAGRSVIELDSGHGNSWLAALTRAGLVERRSDERADLVVDLHHLMHEPVLDPVLEAHRGRLSPGGALVLEFFYARRLLEDRLIDTIRHGHFLYLSLTALLPALERHGLTATRAVEVDVYGGSLRVTARASRDHPPVEASVAAVLDAERRAGFSGSHATVAFAADARTVADDFRRRLEVMASSGLSVAGYGAPSKATVLLSLAGVDERLLPFTVDLSPAKAGRRIPGARVPIYPVDTLLEKRAEFVVILTWDIAHEVTSYLKRLAGEGNWHPRIYVPLPRPREFQLI
ncbi:class I SAM-dependent methyltransferase [Intrasporangium mesophilum]